MAENGDLYGYIRSLPKIELHRHLEGALRLSTLLEIAQQYNLDVPHNLDQLRPLVQIMPDEPRSATNFLSKFATLRMFYCSLEVIDRITFECVEDAARDNIRYFELRFTPKALTNVTQASIKEVIEVVCSAVERASSQYPIQVRLIVSVNRHEPIPYAEHCLKEMLFFKQRGVVALDLAGNEAEFSGAAFAPLFREAKQEGIFSTVHAGEWSGSETVAEALMNMRADRIGHGIRSIEDEGIIQILIKRGILLEVCPSSNLQSGVVASLQTHPLRTLYDLGVKVSINTDDPLISNISLSDEIYRTVQHMHFSLEDIRHITLNAAQAAFLPPAERQKLIESFENGYTTESETSLDS